MTTRAEEVLESDVLDEGGADAAAPLLKLASAEG